MHSGILSRQSMTLSCKEEALVSFLNSSEILFKLSELKISICFSSINSFSLNLNGISSKNSFNCTLSSSEGFSPKIC